MNKILFILVLFLLSSCGVLRQIDQLGREGEQMYKDYPKTICNIRCYAILSSISALNYMVFNNFNQTNTGGFV